MKDNSALPGLCFVFHYPDEGQLRFARLVFCLSLKLPKGQNTMYPGSKCLFEADKGTKHVASGPEMSF